MGKDVFYLIENFDEEEWRDISGFEGYYQVSNLGRVRSLDRENVRSGKGYRTIKGRVLKQLLAGRGYCYVNFSVDGVYSRHYVHRLVANAFIDNPNNKREVNHKDGNKLNNIVSNLEWVNSLENNRHARAIGLINFTEKQQVAFKEYVENKSNPVIVDGYIRFVSERAAAKYIGVNQSVVNYAIKHNRMCKGHSIEYEIKEVKHELSDNEQRLRSNQI